MVGTMPPTIKAQRGDETSLSRAGTPLSRPYCAVPVRLCPGLAEPCRRYRPHWAYRPRQNVPVHDRTSRWDLVFPPHQLVLGWPEGGSFNFQVPKSNRDGVNKTVQTKTTKHLLQLLNFSISGVSTHSFHRKNSELLFYFSRCSSSFRRLRTKWYFQQL
jgi:hypothetical protein